MPLKTPLMTLALLAGGATFGGPLRTAATDSLSNPAVRHAAAIGKPIPSPAARPPVRRAPTPRATPQGPQTHGPAAAPRPSQPADRGFDDDSGSDDDHGSEDHGSDDD